MMLTKVIDFLRPYHKMLFVGLVAGVFGFHLLTLTSYPAPSCDESFYSRTALRYTQALLSGEVWPPVGALFFVPHGRSYWLLLGTALALFGQTIFVARLVSLVGLAGLAAATYFLGRCYATRWTAMWSATLISLAWLSFYTGHFARPDILSAAANTAIIGLLLIATTRRQWLLYFVLGFAATLQLDLHLNALHFLLPITLVSLFQIRRDRSWPHLFSLTTGLLIGGIVFAVLHVGNTFGQIITEAGASPAGFLNNYTSFTGQNIIVNAMTAIADQWWKYYIWFTPYLSLSHAGLFGIGLLYPLFKPRNESLLLVFIAVLSSISFGVVNQRYQLIGYSLYWLPLYIVLGVAALERLGTGWKWGGIQFGALILLGLTALYIAGDIRLASAQLGATYQNDARILFGNMPPGARVLTASYWWPATHRSVTFVDEYLLMPTNSTGWWNGVPELGAEPSLAGEQPAAGENLRSRIAALSPDYIVDDGAIGCLVDERQVALELTAYAEQHCTLVKIFNSSFANRLQPFDRIQSVYACPNP